MSFNNNTSTVVISGEWDCLPFLSTVVHPRFYCGPCSSTWIFFSVVDNCLSNYLYLLSLYWLFLFYSLLPSTPSASSVFLHIMFKSNICKEVKVTSPYKWTRDWPPIPIHIHLNKFSLLWTICYLKGEKHLSTPKLKCHSTCKPSIQKIQNVYTHMMIHCTHMTPFFSLNRSSSINGDINCTCYTCRKHFPVLSSFMTYHRVCN